MAREQFQSDLEWNEARRKVKPHFKLHHSIANHPRTIGAFADNDLFACYCRLGLLASERGAAHTGDRISLSRADVERTSGRRRRDVALTLLERLANVLGWWTERRGDVLVIEFRNFARKQGLTPRGPRSEEADSAASPLPVPVPLSPSAEETSLPSPSVTSLPERTNGRHAGSKPLVGSRELLVQDIVEVTGDQEPESIRFFASAVRQLGEDYVRRTLHSTKDAQRQGEIKTTAARYITGMLAAEMKKRRAHG